VLRRPGKSSATGSRCTGNGEPWPSSVRPRRAITFAFSRGAQFEDKYGLLEGDGKVSKNVRMKNLEDVNHKALRYYIRQALALDKA